MENLLAFFFLAAVIVAMYSFSWITQGRNHSQRPKAPGSNTPPRSLSPQKKETKDASTPTYIDVFPPPRDFTLSVSHVGQCSKLHCKTSLPIATSYLKADNNMCTPCGFTVRDIKQLGNFPDYAALSGVPLPQPYKEFDIKKALPRPYRPLRWGYHQTMCECRQQSIPM